MPENMPTAYSGVRINFYSFLFAFLAKIKVFRQHCSIFVINPVIPRIFQQLNKIKGFKPNTAAFPFDFSTDLQNKVNEICFKIVSGVLVDGKFTFAIRGQIEYVYEYKE